MRRQMRKMQRWLKAVLAAEDAAAARAAEDEMLSILALRKTRLEAVLALFRALHQMARRVTAFAELVEALDDEPLPR